jgi:hypothetical protein
MNDAQNMHAAVGVLSDINKCWTAIACEMTDYAKRSFEDSATTFAKLTSVKSIVQAVEIQTEFTKRAYAAHLKEMTKISGMYAELAKTGLTIAQT